jgi:PqqD family protein of HPr-rel-A system
MTGNPTGTLSLSPEDAIAAGIWRLSPLVRWRLWEDEAVAYNDHTGDTHHFADFAAWVFARLCQKPASVQDLAQEARTSVELRSGENPESVVGRTLDLLWRLRIIEKTPFEPEPGR